MRNPFRYPTQQYQYNIVTLVICALTISACATSTVAAFKDPAYEHVSFERLAVFAEGMTLEEGLKLESEVCSKLAPTPCLTGKSVIAPTHTYTEEEVQSILRANNIDSVLIINLTSDQSATRYYGSLQNTKGTATTSASTTGYAYGVGNSVAYNSQTSSNTSYSSTTTSTPIYSVSRETFSSVTLLDVSERAVAWRGQIKTTGSGLLSTNDGAFIASAASEIASRLLATRFYLQTYGSN